MKKVINIVVFKYIFSCLVIGFILVIISGIDRKNIFDNAKIIDVQDDIIKVEVGEQNGDPIIYEIEKPFYKKYNRGDYISIKNKNGIIKYSFTVNQDFMRNIGIVFITVSMVCLYLYLFYNFIIAIILYRHSKSKNK